MEKTLFKLYRAAITIFARVRQAELKILCVFVWACRVVTRRKSEDGSVANFPPLTLSLPNISIFHERPVLSRLDTAS